MSIAADKNVIRFQELLKQALDKENFFCAIILILVKALEFSIVNYQLNEVHRVGGFVGGALLLLKDRLSIRYTGIFILVMSRGSFSVIPNVQNRILNCGKYRQYCLRPSPPINFLHCLFPFNFLSFRFGEYSSSRKHLATLRSISTTH